MFHKGLWKALPGKNLISSTCSQIPQIFSLSILHFFLNKTLKGISKEKINLPAPFPPAVFPSYEGSGHYGMEL